MSSIAKHEHSTHISCGSILHENHIEENGLIHYPLPNSFHYFNRSLHFLLVTAKQQHRRFSGIAIEDF